MDEVIDLLNSKLLKQERAKQNFWADIFPGCSDQYIAEKQQLIDRRIEQLREAIKLLTDAE